MKEKRRDKQAAAFIMINILNAKMFNYHGKSQRYNGYGYLAKFV